MVDNIKIILSNFSGDLNKKCRKVKPRQLIKNPDNKKYDYDNFRLYNNSGSEKHYLKVSHNKNTKTVTLTGSLRKRSYNRVTLLDMPQSKFIQTLKGIANDLNIPFEELKRARFTQCEVGANIRTRIQAIDILPMIVDYAHYKRIDDYIEKGTLYFNGADRLLKLYVKDDEIAAHTFSEEKRILKKKSFDKLKMKGIHHLRIEFTLKTHRAFKNSGMDHIRTIGDLINCYSELYNFWTKEISRIVVYNSLKYNEIELSEKEKEIVFGLENLGFFDFVDAYQDSYMSNASTLKSTKSAKSKAFTSICEILDKYYDKKIYNKYNLRVDVAKYLIGKSKQFNLDLPVLIRNLWGISLLNKQKK